MLRKYRVNADLWTVLANYMDGLEDFNSDRDSLRGRYYEWASQVRNINTGLMPSDEAARMNDSLISYVIYSYNTPIAYRRVADWNKNGTANYEWVVPDVRYSVTTSKHQGKVRTAASILNRGDVSGR